MSKSSFPLRPLLRVLLPLALALPMAGCLTSTGYGYRSVSAYGYDGPGYVTRYSGYSDAPYSYSRPYSSFWGGSSWCGVCRSSSCRGHHDSIHYSNGDDSFFRSSARTTGPKTLVRMVDYNEKDKRKIPEGYHTKDWWQDKGFSLKDNTYKTTGGEVRGKASSSSGHKSHSDSDSKSSHKSKGKD